MSNRSDAARRGFLLVLGTGIIWGTIGVAAKYLFETTDLDPITVNWLRSLVASIASAALIWPRLRDARRATSMRDVAVMAALGVLLIVYQWLYLASIDRIGVTAATLIALCIPPVMVAAVSTLFLGQPLTRRLLAVLTGALVGTVLLVGRPSGQQVHGSLAVGVLLGLGCAAGFAAHILGSRSIAGRVASLMPLAVGFPAGTLVFAPVVFAHGMNWQQPPAAWLAVLYLGLVPSTLAYLMYQRGLRDVPASTASIVILVEPLTAAALAWVMFGERLSFVSMLGGALLIGSILLLSRREPELAEADAAMSA